MTSAEFLNVVEKTLENRGENYGGVENNFSLISDFWNSYLWNVGEKRSKLNATDVANMMILLKIARTCTANENVLDNYIDICGYGACGGSIISKVK